MPVEEVPDVQYARSGDVAIAYQVVGDGALDIVFARGTAGDLLSSWDQPLLRRMIEDVAELGRLLMLDKRGTGLSDRVREVATLEARMDDLRAVMDAAGSERAVLVAGEDGARLAVMFAAVYPERTAALFLINPSARGRRTAEYPWALGDEEWRTLLAGVREGWGTREYLEARAYDWAPEVADDPEFRGGLVGHMRRSLSPGAALSLYRMMMEADVTDLLSAVRVPTTIVHRSDQRGPAEFFAERIRDVELVELPNLRGVFTWVEDDSHARTMEAARRLVARITRPAERDRVLATVLFTDIVGSTERLSKLGDAGWRDLIERHHAIVRGELGRHHGREVDTAGDGIFASFEGPARAIRCACAIRDQVRALDLEIRAGVHTGECEVAAGKIAGLTVNTGARVAGLAAPGEVLVSSTVRDLVAGSGLEFEDRGEHVLKGIAEPKRLYAVV